MAKEFLLLAFGVVQVVVGEVRKFLSQLSFQLMLFTFELELVHGQVRMGLDLMPEHMERPDCCMGKSFHLSCHSSSP